MAVKKKVVRIKSARPKSRPAKSRSRVRSAPSMKSPPSPMKRKKHPSPLKETKANLIKKKIAQEAAAKKKLYDEQERLWAQRLGALLADGYIRQVLIDLAGENALEIIRNFRGEQSDEELAKRLQLKISDVRATLNRLHNEGLVYYNRQKDSESGWYSYSWMLHKHKLEQWTSRHLEQKNKLDLGGVDNYFCPSCGPESILPFAAATEIQFKCTGCDRNLEFLDDERIQSLFKK